MTYLTIDDPDALLGMEKKERRHYYLPPEEIVECPACCGYGGHHLRLNAYGPGKHFDCGCYQCGGWGWVEKGSKDAECVHEYVEISPEQARAEGAGHFGHCWHVHKCTKCGALRSCDSSD